MTKNYKGIQIEKIEHRHYGLTRFHAQMHSTFSYQTIINGMTISGGTLRETWQRAQVALEFVAQGRDLRNPRDIYDVAEERYGRSLRS